MKHSVRTLLLTLVTSLLSPLVSAQVSTFNTSSNLLTIKLLQVGSNFYSDSTAVLPPGQPWTLQSGGTPTTAFGVGPGTAAVYDSASVLTIPQLQIGTQMLSNVRVSMPVGGQWSVAGAGDILSVGTAGYAMVFPIVTTISNDHAVDAGGELTYKFNNGQVWKHANDDPCMPNSSRATPLGTSTVEIYPNPSFSGSSGVGEGSFRMVTYFNGEVESCLITPIMGFSDYPVASGLNALKVSATAVTGSVNDKKNVFISGGTPPYYVTVDTPGIAWFGLSPQDPARNGQNLQVTLLKTGTATLTVYDYNRQSVTTTVTVNAAAASTFAVGPSSIEAPAGTAWTVFFTGGTPPYRLYSNPNSSMVTVGAISAATASKPAQALISLVKTTGNLEMPIYFADAADTIIAVKVKVTDTSTGTGGTGTGGTGGTGGGIFK